MPADNIVGFGVSFTRGAGFELIDEFFRVDTGDAVERSEGVNVLDVGWRQVRAAVVAIAFLVVIVIVVVMSARRHFVRLLLFRPVRVSNLEIGNS